MNISSAMRHYNLSNLEKERLDVLLDESSFNRDLVEKIENTNIFTKIKANIPKHQIQEDKGKNDKHQLLVDSLDKTGTTSKSNENVECILGNFDENGRLTGKGRKSSKKQQLMYEGDFVDGKYEGKGTKFRLTGGILYIGEFKNNEFHGQGTKYFDEGVNKTVSNLNFTSASNPNSNEIPNYIGQFINGQFDGHG